MHIHTCIHDTLPSRVSLGIPIMALLVPGPPGKHGRLGQTVWRCGGARMLRRPVGGLSGCMERGFMYSIEEQKERNQGF